MRKVNVNWETDGQDVDLPSVVEIPDKIEAEYVADWLSDKYGWLVKNWS